MSPTSSAGSLPLPSLAGGGTAATGRRIAASVTAPGPAFVLASLAWITVGFGRVHEQYPVLLYTYPAKITLGLFLLVALVQLEKLPIREFLQLPTCRWAGWWMLVLVASIPLSFWPGGSVNYARQSVLPSVLLFVTLALAFSDARTARWGIATAMVWVTSAALLPYWRGDGRFAGRFEVGITMDPNTTATFFVMSIPLALMFLNSRRLWLKVLAIVLTLLFVAGVLRTGSRGGVLGLALLVPWLLWGALPKRRLQMMVTVALCGGLLVFGAPEELRSRFREVAQNSDYNYMAQDGRIAIWKRGLSYMVQSPLLGVGVGAFPWKENATKEAMGNRGFRARMTAAHSAFIEVGAELGFLGLGAMLTALVVSVRATHRAQRAVTDGTSAGDWFTPRTFAAGAGGALIGVCTTGLFLSIAYSHLMAFALALCAAATLVARRAQMTGPSVAGPVAQRPVVGHRGGLAC
jgi:O-antigen ligase